MTNLPIHALIPHRNSMKLIDEIIEIDDNHCVTGATVSSCWPLFEDGYTDPIILIELAAQTAGVNIAWHEVVLGKSKEVQLGWLVGIKSAGFYTDRIPLHSRIIMTVEELKSEEAYTEISGTARLGAETIAEMVLQVFRTDMKMEQGAAL